MMVRAIFISDVHLGSKYCKGTRLLTFLHEYQTSTLYLVGDIIDSWCLSKPWPSSHDDVVQKICDIAKSGARVIYIPGNHDAFLRGYHGNRFFNIEIDDQVTHTSARGDRYIVTHGDRYDRTLWLSFMSWFPISGCLKDKLHRATSSIDGSDVTSSSGRSERRHGRRNMWTYPPSVRYESAASAI